MTQKRSPLKPEMALYNSNFFLDQTQCLQSLFADWKGPLIRIGPSELSFYSLEVYRTINFVTTRFAKDPRVYGHFVQDAHPGLFSITFVTPPSPVLTTNTNG